MATSKNGILIKINGLALPANDGFLSMSLPTKTLPMMIMTAETSGNKVSNSGAHVLRPKTLSQYWTNQILITPLPTRARIGPNK